MSRGGAPKPTPSGKLDPSAALAYLLTGVGFWGGVGWLVDKWLGMRLFVAVGLLIGAAAGVYLVYLRSRL